MEVRCQLHSPVDFTLGKEAPVPLNVRLGGLGSYQSMYCVASPIPDCRREQEKGDRPSSADPAGLCASLYTTRSISKDHVTEERNTWCFFGRAIEHLSRV